MVNILDRSSAWDSLVTDYTATVLEAEGDEHDAESGEEDHLNVTFSDGTTLRMKEQAVMNSGHKSWAAALR